MEDVVDGKDLLSPEYINLRPTSTASEDEHMYNLRNQGWGVPRLEWEDTIDGSPVKVDPVLVFEDGATLGDTQRGLPSNADTPVLTCIGIQGEYWRVSIRRESSLSVAKSCSCLLYTSPSPRDKRQSRMPSSA